MLKEDTNETGCDYSMLSDDDKFDCCKISFALGRYQMTLYMTQEEYELWRATCDRRIREAAVEAIELDLGKFLWGKEGPHHRED